MSILKFKGTIIICAVFININFAQTTNDLDTVKIDTSKQKTTNKINPIKIDTVKHKNKNGIVEKQSLRLYGLKILYNNHFNKPSFYILYNNIEYSTSNVSTNYFYRNNNNTTDRLKLFNESLHKLLVREYGMRGKYDLGEVGRYLGITNKIITIALWLLSF